VSVSTTVPSQSTTVGRTPDCDAFMGHQEAEPFDACVLLPTAAARGVTVVTSTTVTTSVMSDPISHLSPISALAETATIADVDRTSSESSSAEEDVSAYQSVTTETMKEPGSSTAEQTAVAPVNPSGVAATVLQRSGSTATTPTRGPAVNNEATNFYDAFPADDEIVTGLVADPEDDGRRLAMRLYEQGRITVDMLGETYQRCRRVKVILTSYASSSVIRRSQVQDDTSAQDADKYLRDQLYKQTGHKL